MINSENNKLSILDTAKDYLRRGWQPLPIGFKSKNPNFDNWQNFAASADELSQYFNGKQQNIGVLLGKPSGNLIDIDLDAPEAVKLADFFLPKTNAEFGRENKPRSHRLYISDFPKIEKFVSPLDGSTLVEIRSTGGQTVFPPSTHPDGEIINWHKDGEPFSIAPDELRRTVTYLASAAMLSRIWRDSVRHDLALCLSGALLRHGWSEADTSHFIKVICAGANDDEISDRVKAVNTTAERIKRGEAVTGLPKLAELTEEKTVKKLCEWLYFDRASSQMPITAGDAPELPKNFILTENGVYHLDPTGEREKAFICSPLRVASFTRDVENNSWGKLLEFSDPDGKEHSLVLPLAALSGDGAELRARLLDAGLFISPNKRNREKLNDYILSAKPARRALCVNQLGWHDGAFVLPDAVISQEPADIRLQNVDRAAHKFKVSGTLAEWQTNIARYCVGNPRLMFAVSCAFAASLLPIAEEPSGGFHLRGLSSTGKTTALQVAGSVWGGDSRKGFLETWRATANGLEAVAELHNNALLCLDEISQINPHDIGETIYCLSNGFGKSRMTRDTKARRKTEWQLLFFSSGEKSLSEMMQGTGQRTFGGQEARFVDLEADAGKGFGLFENLHDFTGASEFSKHLATASRKFYGAAIREFLPHVAGNIESIAKEIKDCRKFFIKTNTDAKASGEVFRVASRFALVAVAGMLASKYGVTGWKQTEPYHSAEQLFQEWLEMRGTSGSIDVARGVRQVLAFIEQHGASRFQSVNDPTAKIQNRVGFRREGDDGETEYLFLPEMFEREVCRGFTASIIAKELDKRGFLRRGERDRFTSKVSLPELGRKNVYVISYTERKDETDAEKFD